MAEKLGVNEMTIVNWEIKGKSSMLQVSGKAKKDYAWACYRSKRFMLILHECVWPLFV